MDVLNNYEHANAILSTLIDAIMARRDVMTDTNKKLSAVSLYPSYFNSSVKLLGKVSRNHVLGLLLLLVLGLLIRFHLCKEYEKPTVKK